MGEKEAVWLLKGSKLILVGREIPCCIRILRGGVLQHIIIIGNWVKGIWSLSVFLITICMWLCNYFKTEDLL